MKKAFVLIGLVIFSSVIFSSVLAQEELPKPWILPDHPLYGIKRWFEGVRMFFTFGEEAKAKLHAHFSELRLAEAEEMIKRGKPEWVRNLMSDYDLEQNEIQKHIRRQLGRNITTLAEHVCNMTYKHIEVLEKVLEKVPEQAKPAIEHAINVSLERHVNCMERILERINKTVEEFKWKVCKSDADCEGLPIYCPPAFEYNFTCHIPPNRTEGICICLPKWRRIWLNCTADVECRHLICPMVLGHDTPVCKEGRCTCGGKWEIINRTEWKERFKEEWTSKIQERVGEEERIYNRTQIGKIFKEMFEEKMWG